MLTILLLGAEITENCCCVSWWSLTFAKLFFMLYKYMQIPCMFVFHIYMLLLLWIWIRFFGFAIFVLIISSHWCNLKILSGYKTELASNALRVCTMKGFEEAKNDLDRTCCVNLGEDITLMLAKVGHTIYFDWLPIFLVLCGLGQNFSDFK